MINVWLAFTCLTAVFFTTLICIIFNNIRVERESRKLLHDIAGLLDRLSSQYLDLESKFFIITQEMRRIDENKQDKS
jgi:hypothetical protein